MDLLIDAAGCALTQGVDPLEATVNFLISSSLPSARIKLTYNLVISRSWNAALTSVLGSAPKLRPAAGSGFSHEKAGHQVPNRYCQWRS